MVEVSKCDLTAWRQDIAETRIELAANLPPHTERGLWAVVDAVEACMLLAGADFEAEMEKVDREIEARLTGRCPALAS